MEDSPALEDKAGGSTLAPESPAEGSNAPQGDAAVSTPDDVVAVADEGAGLPGSNGKKRRIPFRSVSWCKQASMYIPLIFSAYRFNSCIWRCRGLFKHELI